MTERYSSLWLITPCLRGRCPLVAASLGCVHPCDAHQHGHE
jgi:hypothetical protein